MSRFEHLRVRLIGDHKNYHRAKKSEGVTLCAGQLLCLPVWSLDPSQDGFTV